MEASEIKPKRIRKGWSQAELGRHTGMHPATISLIESGRLRPYPVQLEKIEAALLEEVNSDARP